MNHLVKRMFSLMLLVGSTVSCAPQSPVIPQETLSAALTAIVATVESVEAEGTVAAPTPDSPPTLAAAPTTEVVIADEPGTSGQTDAPPTTDIIAIATGASHTCALTVAGGVKCWGANNHGQLGDGTGGNEGDFSVNPVDVVGLSNDVIAVAAGSFHTCALTKTGAIKCWGQNWTNQPGADGLGYELDNYLSPIDVPGLFEGIVAIAAGSQYTCAIDLLGGALCWGANWLGQLGDGEGGDPSSIRPTPRYVYGLSRDVLRIDTGNSHTCAIIAADQIACWGLGEFGQVGDGATRKRNLGPQLVNELWTGITQISAGGLHTCARTSGGGAKCWGSNESGQLGDGTGGYPEAISTSPVDVYGLREGVLVVAAGGNHSCAITADRGVRCWGANERGQLGIGSGDGSAAPSLSPVDVPSLLNRASEIDAGDAHNCVVTIDRGVACWGSNESGQLGDGTTIDRYTPVGVVGLTPAGSSMSGDDVAVIDESVDTIVDVPGADADRLAISVGVGVRHSCALTAAGGVKCWGNNYEGTLGDGTTTDRLLPVDVVGLSGGVSAISVGEYHNCVLTTTGGAKCWARNSSGQLGDGTTTDRYSPVDVAGLSNGVSEISAGANHTCALTSAGGIKCWGSNYVGELGDGNGGSYETESSTPVDTAGLTSGMSGVAAGGSIGSGYSLFSCGLTAAGGVKCWGANSHGQLGDGTETNRLTPVDVVGLGSGVSDLALGAAHTCALTAAGGVKCWGWNLFGQLGDGTTEKRPSPADVPGLTSGVRAIAAGDGYTCAVTTQGGVKCWGDNSFGQLGNGLGGEWGASSPSPVDVAELTSGVVSIAAGYSHTCAVTDAGEVKCWGANDAGQLGEGTAQASLVPVDVVGFGGN